ncbi:hypothetical protein SDC9_103267 [bioreactor metagenome]|uniref:Uncharacterized protein n=1 Tax=bioreactor metagenome TaxID=1076179 RepID=A0A645AT67_9ZZZZ|nr:ATP-grasp domain-containing protein [Romboutsia lituseburensis]
MKRVLILAGGTATAWHLVNEIEKYYKNCIEVYICDTNPKHLIPSSKKAKKFIQVPPIYSELYYDFMIDTLKENKIDIIIPLIDFDLSIFSNDNKDLQNINVKSSAPSKTVAKLLSNKYNMSKYLEGIDVKTPKLYSIDDIEMDKEYILKPKVGFGSRGVIKCRGGEVKLHYNEDYIIQELCKPKEITVEVFNNESTIQTICRERLEVKSGVCTKARIFEDIQLKSIVEKILINIEFPTASCIQFMLNENNQWCVIDINLRLGAGTALSSKVGWQLARASLAQWTERFSSSDEYFKEIKEDKYVVRVYEEVEMI